jgi:two-component system, OmpR family, alkaline phosphatase synthesis response regulator PhoP
MAYILFADDEPRSAEIAADCLAEEGHRVTVVKDGREALERVRAEAPYLLVTDVMMPHADGFLVIRDLCSRYPGKRIPIILLTSLGADGEPPRVDHLDYPIVSCIIRQRPIEELARQIVKAVKRSL